MKILLWIVLVFTSLFYSPTHILAQQSCEGDPCESIGDAEKRAACYSSLVTTCQNKEKTLSGEIQSMDSQIKLTSFRIDTTKAKIQILLDEINALETEVQRLEQVLTSRLSLLVKRIPIAYKRATTPQFGLLLLSTNFSDFVTKIKYIMSVQQEDASLVFQVKSTQNSYNASKEVREDKKIQLEKIQKELEQQNIALARQKKAKNELLAQTKGQEAIYQQLLAQALAEKRAIDQALINSVQVGPIKKGEPIALVGNTGYPGCSTGAHLHFEVRKNGAWTDPGQYLSNKTVTDEQNGGTWSVGSGNWDWPLSDTVRITQHFGQTPWSWRYSYSGGIHTGFDMLSTSSTVIRAPSDGNLFSSSQTCGGSSIIKIKYIDHGEGVISFYLHVQ